MSDNTSHSEEEIELSQLFSLIGNGFNNIIRAFVSAFQQIFRVIISIILFLKDHLFVFGTALFFGLIIGFSLDYLTEDKYGASMVVKPNYSSTRQLYKNIEFYEELVKQKDSVLIAETFNITIAQAASLKSFEIQPVVDDNNLLESYDRFLQSVDSLTVVGFDFQQFVNNFSDFSYYHHEISVISTEREIFQNLENTIVSSIVDNEYFKAQKDVKNEILLRNRDYLNQSLKQVDTLRNVYTEVLLAEATKETSQGTNINMGSSTESSKEIDLFKQENTINNELDQLSKDRVQNSEILNIVSNFQKVGFKMNSIIYKFTLKVPLAFFMLTILFFLLRNFNSFLNSYSRD